MPYSFTPTVEILMKTPGHIQFPPPDTMFALTPFANPSFFGNTKKSVSEPRSSERIYFSSLEIPDSPETSLQKLEHPNIETLEQCIDGFSAQDKEFFGIPDQPSEFQVNATSARSSSSST